MDDDFEREVEDLFNTEAYRIPGDDFDCTDEAFRFSMYRFWSNLNGGKKPRPD